MVLIHFPVGEISRQEVDRQLLEHSGSCHKPCQQSGSNPKICLESLPHHINTQKDNTFNQMHSADSLDGNNQNTHSEPPPDLAGDGVSTEYYEKTTTATRSSITGDTKQQKHHGGGGDFPSNGGDFPSKHHLGIPPSREGDSPNYKEGNPNTGNSPDNPRDNDLNSDKRHSQYLSTDKRAQHKRSYPNYHKDTYHDNQIPQVPRETPNSSISSISTSIHRRVSLLMQIVCSIIPFLAQTLLIGARRYFFYFQKEEVYR